MKIIETCILVWVGVRLCVDGIRQVFARHRKGGVSWPTRM